MSASRGKVIVTGGAGFIGSHATVELCEAGYEPILVDDFSNSERGVVERLERIVGRTLQVYELDCRDRRGLDRAFADQDEIRGVLHFAAHKSVSESVREPERYYDNNLNSLLRLIEVMQARGVQDLVFSSSCTVYGQPETVPVSEESPILPAESPYGHTKQVAEALLQAAVRARRRLRVATLRYFNPIGAHPSGLIGELPIGRPENLVPFITQTAAGLRERLTLFGVDYPTRDGSCIRDFVHVVDLAKAHVAALDWLGRQGAPSHEVFNVGTGRGVSVLEAIRAFDGVTGRSLPWVAGPRREGDITEIYADARRITGAMGWRAERTLEDALRDAWAWQLQLGARAT